MNCQHNKSHELVPEPMDLFHRIVTIQRIIRGFLARRQKLLFKSNKTLLDRERELLIKFGFSNLNSFINSQMLRNTQVSIQENPTNFIISSQDQARWVTFNEYKEGTFENGNFYKGIHYKNGILMQGYFKNDLLQGYGHQKLSDGTTFTGSFNKGIREGQGKLQDKNGNVYEGEFSHNSLNGEGEYYGTDGRYYKGQWKNGQFEGKGEYFYPDGSKYIGEFLKGRRHGYGEYITINGGIYVGQWQYGQQCGKGKLIMEGKEVELIDGRVRQTK